MLNKLVKYSVLFIFLALNNAYALSPIDLLEEGKRAFKLARWEEAREVLQNFMDTWPEHEKYSEALYFHTLASAKNIDERTEAYRAALGKELKEAISHISVDLPKEDISEAKTALMLAQKDKPELWKELEKLKPVELKHYLSRGWYPNPSKTPFETIKWSKSWLSSNANIEPELKSSIATINLSAMWKIMLSPLVMSSSEEELKALEVFPIDRAFSQNLQIAFKNGNLEQKRKAATFGYHFDYFRTNNLVSKKKINSSWFRYLNSRGLSIKEAWSPE